MVILCNFWRCYIEHWVINTTYTTNTTRKAGELKKHILLMRSPSLNKFSIYSCKITVSYFSEHHSSYCVTNSFCFDPQFNTQREHHPWKNQEVLARFTFASGGSYGMSTHTATTTTTTSKPADTTEEALRENNWKFGRKRNNRAKCNPKRACGLAVRDWK